jgi:hypothetical protein
LAQKVAKVMKEYGIVDSTLGMAMDNASNNNSLLKELPHNLPDSATVGTEYQIWCFGHIINLVCQAFLSLFNTSEAAIKADGPLNGEDADCDNSSDDGEDKDEEDELLKDQNTKLCAATSTNVERLFSHGGLQVVKHCHNLLFETIWCLIVLYSWFTAGLVPIDKVLEYFCNLRSQRKGQNVYEAEGEDHDLDLHIEVL